MAIRRIRIIFLVILLKFITVFCSESTKNMQEKEAESFKNLPSLIEHVLDMLQRRPEVLETDDVNVFKRSVDDDCKTTADSRDKRAVRKYDSPANNSPVKYIDEYSHDIEKNAGEFWDPNDIFTQTPDDTTGEFDVTDIESITIGKGNIITKDRKESESDVVLDYDDFYEAANFDVIKTKWNLLSPEEVEEQIMKVEQMLEDYNSKETND